MKTWAKTKPSGTSAEFAAAALRVEAVLAKAPAASRPIPPPRAHNLTYREETILDLLAEYPGGLSNRTIMTELNLGFEHTRRTMQALARRGSVVKLNPDATGPTIWGINYSKETE